MKLHALKHEENFNSQPSVTIEPNAADIHLPAPDTHNGIRVSLVRDLTVAERDSMYSLLGEYYLHVSRQQFERDLAEKEWVVLGTDPISQKAWCFSTLMRLHATMDGERILALYSGDTVARKESWGGQSTPAVRMLVQLMYGIAAESAVQRAYWFMISSTYKSYRLLPMLFRKFYPSPNSRRSKQAERVLGELSELKHFVYDPERSIVRFSNPTVFRPGITENTDAASDPYISFYEIRNPGASQGDRLASLTELSADNLTALGQRFVRSRTDGTAGRTDNHAEAPVSRR
ncbi:MAG: hypothetical protein M3466_19670 [Gemmatimonadota bacterium]|nr:hypothetical protein [Gemmatimonadota bacterium]